MVLPISAQYYEQVNANKDRLAMASITNIRILGWGLVAAIVLNFIGAECFASPEPMDYLIISGMLVAYVPFFISPFRAAFKGKSFSYCVGRGWMTFFLSQWIFLFITMHFDLRYVEFKEIDLNAGVGVSIAMVLGWIPGLIISAVAIVCKKIADQFFSNDRSVLRQVPLIVLACVFCGAGFLVYTKAQENRPIEVIPVDLQSVKVLPNSIGMKLVWIPPGEFQMGSKDYERIHTVKLTKGFWAGQFEVTQDQYQKVMGINPSEYKGDDLPVERISWNDAMEFCRKLGLQEGKTYRLPTEAEWEYACRAGTTTKYSFGDAVGRLWQYGNYCDASNTSQNRDSVRDRRHNDGYDKTAPVGSYPPNPWGLYDIHGNIWEWCADWYQVHYSPEAATDPTGPEKGRSRVLRGGGWNSAFNDCESSARNWATDPATKSDQIGFRVVLDPE
ncbi:MAG: formylglycine-generating enzyme family protein [Phycisphaerae bacterium]|nr:formylglycine-generating enzyme family protein [Phycisphaerae bacterium]